MQIILKKIKNKMEAPEPGCSVSTEKAEAWKSSVQHSPELHEESLSEIRKVPSPDPTPGRRMRVLTENISISAFLFSLERPSCHVTHSENPRTITITLWSTLFRSLDLVVWVCVLGQNDS